MWNHFEKILDDGVLQKGKCNYCKTDIAAHTVHNGTSALRKHFNVCKRNPHKNIGDSKQTVLQVNNGDSVHAWKFDPEAIRNSFAAMIIEDELPFAFGEKSGFKKFVSVACPRFLVPSRRTYTRDIVRIYFEEKSKLKLFLKEQCERVCLTIDCWTSQQQESFMTVTAHFICNEWKLHKKIISFFKVKGHKGDDIGKHLQKTLIDWGVEKVMTITVDNASSNDGGIVYMKKELNKANNSIAGAKYLHMRCAAHIVNLIVTDGLKEVEISVKHMRAAIRYVKNSLARITKFKECAELEKVDTKAFLNLDVATRWNSTYFMLKAAVSYEKVFARYSDEDLYFALDLLSDKGKDKCIGVPDDNDWENARKMADFLGHFADLTTRVSASLHKAMAQRMKDKFDKYWGNWHESDPSKKGKEKENINLMIFISVALDPRYKLSDYTQFAISEIYGKDNGPKVWAAVNKCLRDLFEEYRIMYAPNIASSQAIFSLEAKASGGRGSMMKSLMAKKMKLNNGGSSSSKSELDKFLAEEPDDDGPKFDILAWWKGNSSRFPVLACLARDVLAIPISTVASESAFSTGGRVLDDFRTSLTPFMVEALVCTQDWLRHTIPIDIAENIEELTKLEQELIAEYKDNKAKATKSSTTTKPT
ncbi:hypothetical protein ACQ4PT_014792 [Festuca glaucescens]